MFTLGISDFSLGEGIYPAEVLLRLARTLGYRDLVLWDRSLAGYPKLREKLEWPRQARELAGEPPDPTDDFRIHLGCRFAWHGHDYGALPFTDEGYAALNKLLTDQAHGRGDGEPPRDCVLLAESLAGQELLLREGLQATLLAHPRQAQETRHALERGLPVAAPQVLRFRTAAGLELHRLKGAIHTQRTVARAESLWDGRDGAVPRPAWERRFPAAQPAVARETAARLAGVPARARGRVILRGAAYPSQGAWSGRAGTATRAPRAAWFARSSKSPPWTWGITRRRRATSKRAARRRSACSRPMASSRAVP